MPGAIQTSIAKESVVVTTSLLAFRKLFQEQRFHTLLCRIFPMSILVNYSFSEKAFGN